MDAKVKFIFDALEKAHIRITDFSRIISISTVTLHRWRNGSDISDQLRLNIAHHAAARIEKACRYGELPLREKYKAPERLIVLKKVLASMATR